MYSIYFLIILVSYSDVDTILTMFFGAFLADTGRLDVNGLSSTIHSLRTVQCMMTDDLVSVYW